MEVLGEYPLITPSIISLISSNNSRCNWVILLFFRPDFYIQWPLVVSKKSCHKKVSLKYAPWSCIGKGRPISTAAAFENSFMSNSKLISWYFNTFKKLFQGNSLVMFSYTRQLINPHTFSFRFTNLVLIKLIIGVINVIPAMWVIFHNTIRTFIMILTWYSIKLQQVTLWN